MLLELPVKEEACDFSRSPTCKISAEAPFNFLVSIEDVLFERRSMEDSGSFSDLSAKDLEVSKVCEELCL
ncbi:hypothetical protein HMI55_002816 [Coelomomyces lativittatus]|nr:hypothetical protein HMI55_002816 [Coelomomyces lativittatus]